jgi:hypothetical protein
MRNLSSLVLFAVGLTIGIQAIVYQVSHVAYGDKVASGVLAKIAFASIGLLAFAWLLAGSRLPLRLILFYFIAFIGLRIAALPISRTDFEKWAPVDVYLFFVGVLMFGGALTWGLYRRKARLS